MARKKIIDGSLECVQKQEFGERILQIRRTFFDDNNRQFAEEIGENEKTLSQICSGDRNGGWAIIQKVLSKMPNIDANWLLKGEGEMTKNNQTIGNISNSTVSGVNLHGQNIHIHENYNVLLSIVEKNQRAVEKFQEQIDRMLTIIEKQL